MKKFFLIGASACLGWLVCGCNVGNAPSGMSNEDAADVIAKMKPEDKIRAIANSPMPGPKKEEESAKIERETGVKASDVLGDRRGGIPGTGSVR